jgi:hypothetical protein
VTRFLAIYPALVAVLLAVMPTLAAALGAAIDPGVIEVVGA